MSAEGPSADRWRQGPSGLILEMSSWRSFHERASWSIPTAFSGCAWLPEYREDTSPDERNQLHLDLVTPSLSIIATAVVMLSDKAKCLVRLDSHADLEVSLGTSARTLAESLAPWIIEHLGRHTIDFLVRLQSGSEERWTHDHLKDSPPAERILTAGPLIGPREVAYVTEATLHGWNDRHSDFIATFEEEFAECVGTRFGMATSSCTGALHLALLALGVGPGDEVVVPSTSWVATGAVVRYVGATPVFVDVHDTSWTMLPEALSDAITPRTRAVLPVHLYGVPADMPEICRIAQNAGIAVVEDAAPAVGASISNRPAGSFGDAAAFSFQGAKLLVTGEGGMLVTSDAELRDAAWKQQDHGRRPGTFWIDEVGRKYKMSNATAALGLAQLRSLDLQVAKKREINRWYREALGDVPGVTFQSERPDSKAIYWMTSVEFAGGGEQLDQVIGALRRAGIDTRPVFPPMSAFPIWGSTAGQVHSQDVARRIGLGAINLPSGVRLTQASVHRVAEVISGVVSRDA